MNLESKDYAHLHVHTEYSTLDGINRIDTLAEHVKKQGQTACAITDHGNMSGTYKFWKAAQKIGIKPIIGIEAYYVVTDRHVKDKDEDERNYYHLILLAKNRKGLENLFTLTTKSYTEGFYHKPRIDDDLLAQYSGDLIATSACLGSRTSQLILNNRTQEAEKLLKHHAEIFKDNFFLEIQLHEESEQQAVNVALIEISKRTGLPLVLTGDCFPPETIVQTIEGYKTIEDIVIGDFVLTHTGDYQPVEVVAKRHHDGDMNVIKIANCTKLIECTSEHPILIYRNSSYQWVNAKDITTSDFLTFPIIKDNEEKIKLNFANKNGELTPDLAWWLGIFCAEGSSSIKKDTSYCTISFALSLEERSIAERIVKIAADEIGIRFKIKTYRNWIQVKGHNTQLGMLLREWFNHGSRNKKVPEFILKSSPIIKEQFLEGLFEGDGDHQHTAQLATASKKLAYGVKQLLASIGFWGNVTSLKQKCQTGVFDQYRISWTKNTNGQSTKIVDNYLLRRVVSNTTKKYQGPVFNLQVAKDNTFVTEVTVHNCHYLQEQDKTIHEQALCIQTKSTMSSDKRFTFGDIDVHVATTELMLERAARQNIPLEALKNTSLIAQSVDDLDYFTNIVNRYPKFQSLPDGISSWEALERITKHSLTEKMGGHVPDEYKKRINEELVAIKRMGFSDYMLIVWEYIHGAREAGVMVGPGRGSAAGSLVAYALGITQLDPIKYRLLFSRFLNEGRGAIPEIFTKEMKARIDSMPPPQPEHSHHHHHGKH